MIQGAAGHAIHGVGGHHEGTEHPAGEQDGAPQGGQTQHDEAQPDPSHGLAQIRGEGDHHTLHVIHVLQGHEQRGALVLVEPDLAIMTPVPAQVALAGSIVVPRPHLDPQLLRQIPGPGHGILCLLHLAGQVQGRVAALQDEGRQQGTQEEGCGQQPRAEDSEDQEPREAQAHPTGESHRSFPGTR